MSEIVNEREASATIRGYIYQFDATIRNILASNANDICMVEDVEDFDIHSCDLSSYYQCKYYASQKLTPSVLRDSILPMIKNFIALDLHKRTSKRYHLYGHFKESSFEKNKFTFEILKYVLVRREKSKETDNNSKFKTINVQTEIGATDEDLKNFINVFTIEFCPEYEEHKRNTISELKTAVGVSQLESELFIYPSALTVISNLACGKSIKSRTITKNQFLQKIRPNQSIYSLWSLREKNKTTYCREMRSKYFSKNNIDPEARFFILEISGGTSELDIIRSILTIRRKWSSHLMRRKPDQERYAPYIYLNNISQESLARIKNKVHQSGCIFVDGYPFFGSTFSLTSICKSQTFQNKISIRFINTKEDLDTCLSAITQSKVVYQFFFNKPLNIDEDITQVCIPISSNGMIAEIV